MALTQTQVSQLYVSIFGRASEGEGNTYWQTNATDMATAATQMLATDDAIAYFGSSLDSDLAFVTHIYLNTLNKTYADDATGIDYWVAELASGVARGTVVANLAAAVNDYATSTDPVTLAAYNQFTNRVTVSNYMADTVQEAPADYATSTRFASSGTTGLVVTSDAATVESAQLAVGDIVAPSYTLAAAATSVTEGNSVVFTVTTSHAVSTDTVVNYQIQGVAVAGGTATPVADLGVLNGTLTIAAGATTGTITLTPSSDSVTEGYEGFKVVLLDSSFATIASSGNVVIQDPENAGQTFTLTTGVDGAPAFTGGAGDDIYTALIAHDGTDDTSTWSALDSLNGGAGTDVLNINSISVTTNDAINLALGTLANIETINIQAVADIGYKNNGTADDALDVSAITGLTTINTTKSVDVKLIAADTTDVNVSGATGAIVVEGGKNIVVSDATAAEAITVGDGAAAGDAAGTITVTDTNNTGANAISVEGGTDVTVTTTAAKANSEAITVGHATNGMATGAVVVTQNTTSDGTTAIAGDVTVTGGSTVNITANMTNTAVKSGTANAITAGTYAVVAGNTTTAVTITQNAVATDFASDAAAVVRETTVVTFKAMAINEVLTMNGLTFTAAKALTAEQVAEAFAGLTAADTQDAGGSVANGKYSGTFNTGAWTTSAASGATVTFTAADDNEADIAFTGNATTNDSGARIPTQVKTAGTAAAASTAVNVTADFGAVTVNDNATKSITTITLNGYDTAVLGGTSSLDALTTLNLSNSAGNNTLTSTSTTLTANLNAITGVATNLGGSVTALTINTTGTASSTGLTAGALKNLTVNAAANLTVAPTSIAVLETLTVTGTGSVTMGDISAATTTITAGTASGAISATVDGTKAVVTTGSGADSITVDTATQTKAINLGAGNDTLTYSTATMGVPAAATNGGEGTDTVAMTSASAASLDANTNFATALTSFERLTITDTSAVVLEADILGFNYVTYAAAATAGAELNDVAANSTTVLEAASNDVDIVLDDATGTSDVANVVLNNKSANVAQTKAVYALDLTALATTGTTSTITVGGVTVLTGVYTAATAAAALAGTTVTIAGVTYDITSPSASNIVLTAKTFSDVLVGDTIDAAAVAGNGAATQSTQAAQAPSTLGEDGAADVAFGTVTIAGVETVNLNSNDTTTSVVSAVDANSVTLVLDAATTLNITGTSDVALTTTTAPLLTTVNASALTGVLTYTAGVASSTITGGSAADSITVADGADGSTINGGDGNDTFIIQADADTITLNGGAGADTFEFTGVSTTDSNFAVINGVTSGDVIDMGGLGVNAFASTAITLAVGASQNTQAFQEAAMNALATNAAGWFQFNSGSGVNTYIVADSDGDATYDASDFTVVIVGAVDLSTASFNTTNGTLEIA